MPVAAPTDDTHPDDADRADRPQPVARPDPRLAPGARTRARAGDPARHRPSSTGSWSSTDAGSSAGRRPCIVPAGEVPSWRSVGWIIFLVLAIPLVGVIVWVALDESFVRIEPGQLGLLLVRGRATDTVLEPGPHWVPALRRRLVQTYPSLELSFTAGADGRSEDDTDPLARFAPALQVNLGDREPGDGRATRSASGSTASSSSSSTSGSAPTASGRRCATAAPVCCGRSSAGPTW